MPIDKALTEKTKSMDDEELVNAFAAAVSASHAEYVDAHRASTEAALEKAEILFRMDHLALIDSVQKYCRKRILELLRHAQQECWSIGRMIYIVQTEPLKYTKEVDRELPASTR